MSSLVFGDSACVLLSTHVHSKSYEVGRRGSLNKSDLVYYIQVRMPACLPGWVVVMKGPSEPHKLPFSLSEVSLSESVVLLSSTQIHECRLLSVAQKTSGRDRDLYLYICTYVYVHSSMVLVRKNKRL